MTPIRCSLCREWHVDGTTLQILRSDRYPTVYLHAECQRIVWKRLHVELGFTCKLVNELADNTFTGLMREDGYKAA